MTELKGLDSKPCARRIPSSSMSQTLTTMSINQATSECVSNLESERISNPKSYETMFAIPVSSKFGGLKKRSQVMQSVSGMKSDEKDFSNTAVIKVENLEKICNFQ